MIIPFLNFSKHIPLRFEYIFLIYIGIGFGEAVVKAVEGIDEAKKEWDSQNANPIDSMKNSIIEIIDSLEQKD